MPLQPGLPTKVPPSDAPREESADLPTLPSPRGIRDEEYAAFRAAALRRVSAAHRELNDARDAQKERASQRAGLRVARATLQLRRAIRGLLWADLIYSTRARRSELLRARLETFEWFPDGRVHFILPGKAARSTDPNAPDPSERKRMRRAGLTPQLGSRLRVWLIDTSPDGRLPTTGPLQNAGGPRPVVSDDTIESDIDAIAREAGVQQYQAPNPRARAPAPGHAKKSHKYLFRAHALREYGGRLLVRRGKSRELVAKSEGHSIHVFDNDYFKVDVDEAFELADALGV